MTADPFPPRAACSSCQEPWPCNGWVYGPAGGFSWLGCATERAMAGARAALWNRP